MRTKIISAKKAKNFDDPDFTDDDLIEIIEDDDGNLSYIITNQEEVNSKIRNGRYEDIDPIFKLTFEQLCEEEE